MSKFILLPVALAAVGMLAASCSAIDPKVGAQQDASTCAASASSSPYGGGSSKPAGDAGSCATEEPPDPRCAEDAGYEDGECDRCEDTHCCDQRFDCYDDPACFTADEELDECLDEAEESDAGDEDTLRSACWDSFTSNPGPLAKDLTACERQSCKDVCEVP